MRLIKYKVIRKIKMSVIIKQTFDSPFESFKGSLDIWMCLPAVLLCVFFLSHPCAVISWVSKGHRLKPTGQLVSWAVILLPGRTISQPSWRYLQGNSRCWWQSSMRWCLPFLYSLLQMGQRFVRWRHLLQTICPMTQQGINWWVNIPKADWTFVCFKALVVQCFWTPESKRKHNISISKCVGMAYKVHNIQANCWMWYDLILSWVCCVNLLLISIGTPKSLY